MKKLDDSKTQLLLKKYSIPSVKQSLAKNSKQAVQFSKKFGYPVVLKISSPDIIHKTDSKGVILNLKNEKEVETSFNKLVSSARKKKARVSGVLVQKQSSGREIIVGSKIDPTFGPTIMFGLGGIFVEVLKDVTFRLVPIQRKDAKEMISEIKGSAILEGIRGEKPINFKKLEDFLLKVSKMIEKTKLKELDINPAFANEKEIIAADVRIFM